MLNRTLNITPPAGAGLNWGHALTNKLLAAWPTNEWSGTAIYDLVSSRRASFMNTGVTWSGRTRGTMARFSGAGSNGYAELADFPELNALPQMSISVLIYRLGNTQFDGIINRATTVSVGFDLNLAGTLGGVDDIFFRVSPTTNGPDYGYTSDGSVPLGGWVHVVAVFDGTQTGNSNRMKVYINGVQKTLTFGGTIPAVTPTVASRPLRIGRVEYSSGATNNYFNGFIHFPCIWTRALSADEVDQLYVNPYQMLRLRRGIQPIVSSSAIFGNINNPIFFG
jgi:hypothetical protein